MPCCVFVSDRNLIILFSDSILELKQDFEVQKIKYAIIKLQNSFIAKVVSVQHVLFT